MIWWPFNNKTYVQEQLRKVVTHQWSGDPSISAALNTSLLAVVVTHQWSGDPSIKVKLHNSQAIVS